MNHKIKLGVYAALILGATIFGVLFYSSYKNANAAVDATNLPPAEAVAIALSTNVPGATNESTNPPAATNVVTQTNAAVASPETNVATNLPSTNEPSEPVVQTYGSLSSSGRQNQDRSSMIGYFVAFLGISILLGLLIGHDISHYFGSRSVEFMFNDEGTGIKNP